MTEHEARNLVGYARASSSDETHGLQVDALVSYGVERAAIFWGTLSGQSSKGSPDAFDIGRCMRPGTKLVVWRLDRLGRNLSELVQVIDLIRSRGAHLVSLTEQIDTATMEGKTLFDVVGMFAQIERDMLSERTKTSLAARRAQGHRPGRKNPFGPAHEKWQDAVQLVRNGVSFVDIADQIEGVSKSTLYTNADDLRAAAALWDAGQ